MYYDHEHEGDQYEPCQYVIARVRTDAQGERYVERTVCGKDWTSVVHPPDQFRHWCRALEAGGDCMCFEAF